jgi:integrase
MNRRPLGTKLSRALLGFQQFKTEALSPGTLVSYDCALRLWLSHVGDVDLKEITTSKALEYLAWLRVEYEPRRLSGREGPLSPKTIRNAYATLSAFFKWACAEFNLPNPKSSSNLGCTRFGCAARFWVTHVPYLDFLTLGILSHNYWQSIFDIGKTP